MPFLTFLFNRVANINIKITDRKKTGRYFQGKAKKFLTKNGGYHEFKYIIT
jgi:hypothetical protein